MRWKEVNSGGGIGGVNVGLTLGNIKKGVGWIGV